jgi:hypothetical protein
MTEDTDRPLSREERIEMFGEEKVEHTEWWSEETGRVDDVIQEIVTVVEDRDDVQLARRGSSVGRDGKHEARFRLVVAGEPWRGVEDGDST